MKRATLAFSEFTDWNLFGRANYSLESITHTGAVTRELGRSKLVAYVSRF